MFLYIYLFGLCVTATPDLFLLRDISRAETSLCNCAHVNIIIGKFGLWVQHETTIWISVIFYRLNNNIEITGNFKRQNKHMRSTYSHTCKHTLINLLTLTLSLSLSLSLSRSLSLCPLCWEQFSDGSATTDTSKTKDLKNHRITMMERCSA